MDTFFQDLNYALRKLIKKPSYLVLAVLTLAIGVGANAAIFGIFDAVVLQPLPYSDPETLISMGRTQEQNPGRTSSMSQPDIEDILRDGASLDGLAGIQNTGVTLSTPDGSPEVIPSASVTGGLLEIFGLAPVEGRDLQQSDNIPNGPRVVVVSQDFARQYLDGVRPLIGHTLVLDGELTEIVGVAPAGFSYPTGAMTWKPLYNDLEGCGRGCHLLSGVGRLAPGHTIDDATTELATIAARLSQDYPESNLGKSFVVTDLKQSMLGGADQSLLILMACVTFVLFIAAANLAGLQMARGSARKSEFSLRAALGASRGRLCSLLLLETLILGLAGGLLGFVIAGAATRLAVAAAPSGLARVENINLDFRVFTFSLLAALGSSLLLALWPAWKLAASSVQTSKRSTESRSEVRGRSMLMVGEVALCLTLLIGAGLLLKTYDRMLSVDLGFTPEHLSSFFVVLPDGAYSGPESRIAATQQLEEKLSEIAGITSVASILGRPFSGNSIGAGVYFTDEPEPEPGKEPTSRMRIVTDGYVSTFALSLREGRDLAPTDRTGSQPVALVNESFVRQLANGESPVGRQIQTSIDFGLAELPRTIVGVVGDTVTENISAGTRPEIFIPQTQMASPWLSMVVKTEGETPWREITAAVASVDPNMPLRRKETLNEAIAGALGPARFYFQLLASFSLIAVFLASIGLYGVVSQIVTRRSREIAVRMAVGANSTRVINQILAEGLKTVGLGILIGLTLSALGARFLASLLFEVEPLDPIVYAAGVAGLLMASLLALLAPALRAGRMEPARALSRD